jgi:hypothetical protein
MQCERCKEEIERGEEREYAGQVLCEECYMDALSPARACDPWAVHSAKSFAENGTAPIQLTDTQEKILQVLEETRGIEPKDLCEKLQLSPSDLERDIAALRHMEKLRGELRDGKKILKLW